MHVRKFLPHLLAATVLLGGAFVAFAAETTKDTMEISYTPLAPLPLGEGGAELKEYTISTYLSGMLKLIIALGAAFAVLRGIIGGVQYIASGITPDAKNRAKSDINNAIIGLVIVLTSYLILNTLNPDLVKFKWSLPKIEGTHAEVTMVTTGDEPCTNVSDCADGYICTGVIANEMGTVEGSGKCTSAKVTGSLCSAASSSLPANSPWPSDKYERDKLKDDYNITVNKSNCTVVGTYGAISQPAGASNCTSVCGLKSDVITKIGAIKKDCESDNHGCLVHITGGTEYWLHKTHGTYRNVDFNSNEWFDAYIKDKSIYLGTNQSCGVYSAEHWAMGTTGIFVYEPNKNGDGYHWHACF